MRVLAAAIVLAASALAQSNPSFGDLDRTRIEIGRLEELVREGAIAKNRLDQAKSQLADAQDDEVLKKTLFGKLTVEDLTDVQADEMLAAARRRVERLTPRLETMRKLLAEGVIAKAEIKPVEEEIEIRRQTLVLAESRAKTISELLDLIRAEQEAETRAAEQQAIARDWKLFERFEGQSLFRVTMLKGIEQAFEKKFARTLPVSANGMTALHRSMGFDHRDRVDVALTPDSAEGIWLRRFLEQAGIPYFAFRSMLPGSATGPHIHIGPPSLRLRSFAD